MLEDLGQRRQVPVDLDLEPLVEGLESPLEVRELDLEPLVEDPGLPLEGPGSALAVVERPTEAEQAARQELVEEYPGLALERRCLTLARFEVFRGWAYLWTSACRALWQC